MKRKQVIIMIVAAMIIYGALAAIGYYAHENKTSIINMLPRWHATCVATEFQ